MYDIRSALFHLELLQTEIVFWVFLFKSMWGEMIDGGGGIVIAGKLGGI